MKKIPSPILAIFLGIIILGSGLVINNLSKNEQPNNNEEETLKTASVQSPEKRTDSSWMDDLDRVIPPEERKWITESGSPRQTMSQSMITELLSGIFQDGSNLNALNNQDSDYYKNFSQEYIEKESESLIQPEDLFSLENIIIKENATKEDIRKYGNQVGLLIVENFLGLEHEADVFKELITYQSREAKTKLIKIGTHYEKVAKGMMEIPAPIEIAETHLNLSNYMKESSIYIKNMASMLEDPVIALASANKRFEENQNLTPLLEKVTEYFQKQNISFAKDEPGVAYIITYD